MADRFFILPRRNDCNGANVQVLDLFPNSSQRNGVLDGAGQTFYVGRADAPGATVRNGDAYSEGSLFTLLDSPDEPALDDTTGGGNDCLATYTACFGLAAYLVDRVQRAGAGGGHLTPANAMSMAAGILARVEAGADLDLAGINAALAAVVGGTALTTAGGSKSWGTVVDILRILSGEVYRVPRHTIITNAANLFLNAVERRVLVAAQDIAANGGVTFGWTGAWLTATESGYQARPVLTETDFALCSLAGGHLHALLSDMTFVNPAYAYRLADVTSYRPRAVDRAGNAIPATGTHEVIRVYDDHGDLM